MEVSEDFYDHLVFRGKRSKRARPLSPVDQLVAGPAITSSSSTGGCGGGGGGGGGGYSSSVQYYSPSPTTSTTQISSSTEEDKDMANCLILLAQSGTNCGRKVAKFESEAKTTHQKSSRKFSEMISNATGKAGFYVYECKTCNRTFPSFQALGGHRASHKKPKNMVVEEKRPATATATATAAASSAASAAAVGGGGGGSLLDDHDGDGDDQEEGKFNRLSVLSKQIVVNNNKANKVHECSICGSEFASGQALGGHMRRHRPPSIITNTTKVSDQLSNDHMNGIGGDVVVEKEKLSSRNILPLDLNLPAPPEDDHGETNFDFSDNNRQSLVFSAAALVDCHY